jgi:rod shape determining protein RodA
MRMTYLEYQVRTVPAGLSKILHVNWPLFLAIAAVAAVGILQLTSVAGGDFGRWAEPQAKRLVVGLVGMIVVAMVPIWFWRSVSAVAYAAALLMLVAVELAGSVGMGAQRWLDLGVIRIQPSELMKVALVMVLAAYYDWLEPDRTSRPLWVILPLVLIGLPVLLILMQPHLGTAVLTALIGVTMMFLAGLSIWYFVVAALAGGGAVAAVLMSRGTTWQLLHDYQYRRIDTFLDPTADPLGAGYNIIQAKIALGSGAWAGKGFMQGTQSRLNFLPEKHTDFIFTTLGEEFGLVGGLSLLLLYALILFFCISSALQMRDRFSSLLVLGLAASLFYNLVINLAMVMGLAPVVGLPLPFLSYGGSNLMVLLLAFGLVQSAHVHRPRSRS